MRRSWDSTTTTVALAVVVAMILGVSLQQFVRSGLLYLGLARQQAIEQDDARLELQLPERIAFLMEALERTPDFERQVVIAAARHQHLGLRLFDGHDPNIVQTDAPSADLLHRQIEAALASPHPVIVAARSQLASPATRTGHARVPSGIVVDAALSDGHWLRVWTSLDPPPVVDPVAVEFSRASVAIWFAISSLLAMLLSVIAARRVVQPLSELAVAVDQLGGRGDDPPIPPHGPREVEGVIRAFNRMRERLHRFNEDRTRMIGAMSHDLRTPLTRLRVRIELAAGLEDQQKMLGELDMMNGMVESILSFARDDAKQEPRSLVDLSALVEGICGDAADAGEPVTFVGPRDLTVSCRPVAIRRAISNLVDNAVKYAGKADVMLAPEADRVVILVEDEGPGIPRSERDKVFEPFYRIGSARDPATGGVGLGLSVTRSIVWEHGGEISLATRKGGGLRVRVELPCDSRPSPSGRQELGGDPIQIGTDG